MEIHRLFRFQELIESYGSTCIVSFHQILESSISDILSLPGINLSIISHICQLVPRICELLGNAGNMSPTVQT